MIKPITLEDAEKLAMTTDYACFATGEEINTADAGAFFLEGYEYAIKESEKETVPDLSGSTPEQRTLIIKELTETTAKAVLTVFVALGLKTHIEARVINDATGDEFLLKFNKIEKDIQSA